MDFSKKYNRSEFMNFLRTSFLPGDFEGANEELYITPNAKRYTQSATLLGRCDSLDLTVLEMQHTSKGDARVALSKEAFRILNDSFCSRALVMFVPLDSDANYRFSLIEITLHADPNNPRISKEYSNPRRFSYYLGEGIATYTPHKFLIDRGRVNDKDDLFDRFSVEVLTKHFYSELQDWYAWAIKEIKFPNKLGDTTDDQVFNNESAIRLITRLIFVWFLKQRHLVPDEFFDQLYLSEKILKDFHPNMTYGLFAQKSTESQYYKAILQNLFFAMLNSPIMDEKGAQKMRRFSKMDYNDHGNTKLMRHKWMFKNPQLFLDLANKVPFLNGGLFDCLDEEQNGIYYDGFSDREVVRKAICVPDYLFFGERNDIDISDWSMDRAKRNTTISGIIDILKRYNFTVEENTPYDKEVSLDPELLGKVFENLLAAFNPETQTSARKQTGSFYTPREIVQFMVDESLVAHLKRTVSSDLEDSFRKLLQYTDDDPELSDEQKQKIIKSLYNCKILDPACGSGAFPMGVLQQMVHILQRIDPENQGWEKMMMQIAIDETSQAYKNLSSDERRERIKDIEHSFDDNLNRPDYARKLYLIENCIYGVDIQPIAIQISKLRFFISLVIDQITNSKSEDNFGIRPLPNLEAKFVAANSLIGLQKHDASIFDLSSVSEKEKQLREARHRIFAAQTYATKKKYRLQVATLREEIANLLSQNNVVRNEDARELAQWDMFDQNHFAPFFDPMWMFGVEGFDIVLGNPPYVQLQNNEGQLRRLYQNAGYETFASTGDLYGMFYEKGWRLLNNAGHLCFITSNKWMRAAYGEKLRAFFAKNTNPEILVDFGGIQVFESATVDTNILLFSKAKNLQKTKSLVIGKSHEDSFSNLSDFVKHNHAIIGFDNSDSWVILSPIELSIKHKIESVGTPLKDWNISIYRGVLTGCNEAFIINTEKRNEILSNCITEDERKRTDELLRPILRGRDIKRYGYDWAGLYLIWVPWHFPLHLDNSIQGASEKAEKEFLRQYPAVYQHLLLYKSQLSERNKAETGIRYEWYALQRWGANYWEDFDKPKISWASVGETYYSLIPKGTLLLDTNYFFSIEAPYYLLSFLNSSLITWWINSEDTPIGNGGAYRHYKYNIERLSIPQSSDIINDLIKRVCEDVQISEIQSDVNKAVYLAYKLNSQEIIYIEKYVEELNNIYESN